MFNKELEKENLNLNYKVKNLKKVLNKILENTILNKEEIVKRLDICKTCDKLSDKICTMCGCLIDEKVIYKSFKCPIGKW